MSRDLGITERFWYPATSDEDGERAEFFQSYTPVAKELVEHLRLHPATETNAASCIVLLGEMGIGKSTVLHSMEGEAREQGKEVVTRSFKEFQSPAEVRQLLASVTNQQKTIYLDGLDEFHLPGGMDALLGALRDQIGRGNSWRLRLTCRSADWDGSLLNLLERIWGSTEVQVLRLAPLRKEDIWTAARLQGFNPEAFLTQVERLGLVVFARLPLALRGLLAQWEKNKELSGGRWDLFEAACRDLCRDTQPRTEHTKGLPVDQRVRIASAVALTLLLGRKIGVLIDGSKDEKYVALEELRWCAKRVLGEVSDADADAGLLDVLTNTALFRAEPPVCRFDHAGYQDFLAANCLADAKVSEDRWMELVAVPNAGIVPQLRGLAGWLCYRSTSFMSAVAERDFATLLLTGVDVMTDEVRKSIVEQILIHPMKWQATSQNYFSWAPYQLLKYDGLDQQLEGWLSDRDSPDQSLVEALTLAAKNNLSSLSPLIADLALDATKHIRVRSEAALAIGELGSEHDRKQLIPLIDGVEGDDHDELKGYALRAVWPGRLISAEEFFRVLTPPKKSNFYGGYAGFLSRGVVPNLQDSDLLAGLEWVLEHGRLTIFGLWNDLVDHIMQRSWTLLLENPELEKPFAKAVLRFIKEHQSPLQDGADRSMGEPLPDGRDAQRRQRLLTVLVEELNASADELSYLVYLDRHLVLEGGVQFLLHAAGEATSADKARTYAQLAAMAFMYDDVFFEKNYEVLLGLVGYSNVQGTSQHPEEIKAVFKSYVGSVRIESDEAKMLKASHLKNKEFASMVAEQQRRREEKRKPPEWRVTKIEEFLEIFDNGNEGAWVNIAGIVCADDQGELRSWLGSPLSSQPSWSILSEELRGRILEAGRHFLEKARPVDPEKRNTIYHYNTAGYAALTTLLKSSKADDNLRHLIGKWSVAIIHQPVSFGTADSSENIHEQLLHLALEVDTPKAIAEAARYLQWEGEEHSFSGLLFRFEKKHPEALCNMLLGLVKDRMTFDEFCLSVLEKLLEWHHAEAEEYAFRAWEDARDTAEEEKAIAIASKLLVTPTITKAWPMLEDWLLGNEDVGKQVLLKVSAHPYRRKRQFGDLSADQRLRLSLFMERVFARKNDAEYIPDVAHCIGEEEEARQLRDQLLSLFESEGEVEQLIQLRREFPSYEWIDRLIYRAQEESSILPDSAMGPEQVSTLITQSSTRVDNGEDQA